MENNLNTCTFCGKSFSKERTLQVHVCEPKRRHLQKNEKWVQNAFMVFQRFYQIHQNNGKPKTYEDFCESSYYRAFVKFGNYCVNINAVAPERFMSWLLKNQKKIDHWCKDSLYEEWMMGYLQQEAVQDALERALKEMQDYADQHPDLKNGFKDYFRYGNGNKICYHISNGRVSPWVIFNCDSGIDFLGSLNEEQLAMIMPWVDPDFWQRKFKDYAADAEWVKDILNKAGL